MTIDEAIEIKKRWKQANYPPPLADEINADNLSIEALKYWQMSRKSGGTLLRFLLPGETEE